MFVANDKNGNRVDADEGIKGEKYYCTVCEHEVRFKKGEIKSPHFAHITKMECDDWYEMSEWHRKFQELFPEEYREVVITNGNEKHRADIKIGNVVIEFQHSPMSAEEFIKRTEFYGENHRLIWVFDVRGKDIKKVPGMMARNLITGEIRKLPDNQYEWKWAYKFDNQKYNIKKYDLFLFTDIGFIKVSGTQNYEPHYKYFYGYTYTKDSFLKFVMNRVKDCQHGVERFSKQKQKQREDTIRKHQSTEVTEKQTSNELDELFDEIVDRLIDGK